MAALQLSTSTTASSYEPPCRAESAAAAADQFPAGLRVLVVDDDITCLRILEQMLRRCLYHVTPCSQATVALNLLREKKGCFDLVLSDVHMPDMDGFKLLELVGLEMDLPVIMVSADGRTSAVMRGIRHGACDYLIKPIREEELKNIWQHVVRKKWNGNKEHEHSGSLDETDRLKRGNDEAEYASSVTEGTEGILKTQKKRRDSKEEDDDELENDDPASSKKPRVVWSVELHQQFVSAVNQLGIDKAVPKRILELMNVPGLTRENVASHLQKFRLYLKRLSGVAQQQGGIPNSFCGPGEPNAKLGPLGRFDIQALAASGQIPPQTLAALHAELLGQPTNNLVLDQPALLQASLHGQPLMKCPSNISKHFPHPIISVEDVHPRFGSWPSNTLSTVGPTSNLTGLGAQSGNMLMGMLQVQQQQQKQSMLPESSRLINVQPSCLVVPSQARNSPLVNQSGFNRSSAVNYSLLSPQSNDSSFSAGHMSDRDLQKTGVLHGYSAAGVVSPSMSSCSENADNGASRPVQNPNQGSYSYSSGQILDQGPLKNLGFVGKGTSIPSRFAVDEPESPVNNLNYVKVCGENKGNRVKQEPNMDFNDNAKVGIPILPHFPSGDLMSVFSE